MLKVLPNSVPNGVNKSIGFAYVLLKESLKSFPADRNISLVLYLTLVLLPAEHSGIF